MLSLLRKNRNSMNVHLTSRQIESYHRRVLDPSELIELDEHLANCKSCRIELNAVGQASDKFFSLKKNLASEAISEHLDYKQLEAFADGSLKPEEIEIVESHLAVCEECELLASDLVVFREQARPGLAREYAPRVEETQQPKPVSLPDKPTRKWRSLFGINSPALAFGMGALAMLVVGSVIFLIVRASRSGPSAPQVAQSSSPAPTASPVIDPLAGANPIPTPSPSPQVLLALNDGAKQIGIDEHGNLVGLDDLPPGAKETVKTALITQQAVNLATISDVGSPQGVLRGGANQGSSFTPLSPIGKVLVTTRPTFRWTKLEGATEYRVEIYDSNFSLAASSPPLTSNSWNLPNVLERGEVYTWQVTATKDGEKIKTPIPPAPESKFKILDAKRADELTVARKNYASSHLALGVLYAQAGLLDEAETEFTALSKANPQSEVALKLLKNLQAARNAGTK